MWTGITLILLSVVLIWSGCIWFRKNSARAPTLALFSLATVGLVLGVFLAFTGRALAGDSGTATADLRPLWGYGVEVMGGLLTGLAGLATRALTRHLKVKDQDRTREYLERAMQLGIQYAMELAIRKGDDLAQVKVRDELVAAAATYAARAVPDALRMFGIDEAGLKDRLRARLPEIVPHPEQPAAFSQAG